MNVNVKTLQSEEIQKMTEMSGIVAANTNFFLTAEYLCFIVSS